MPNPQELNARIHELEKRVKELEVKLAEYQSIEGYYLKRYQEIFAEIKKARDEEIKQTLENITAEISNLKREKEDVSKALEENINIKKQIKEIDFQLQELYNQTETFSLDAESEINELEQTSLQINVQHKEQLQKYVNKLYKLLTPPYIEANILFLTDAIFNYLRTEGFESVKTMKQNHRGAQLIKKSLDRKNTEFQENISQLNIARESLLAKYLEIEQNNLDNIQRDIVHYTSLQEKYYEDIMNALEKVREKHELLIVEKIKKAFVLGYTSLAVGEQIDDFLKILTQELMTVDTVENKVYQKEKRLQKLKEEAARLHELDIEKEKLTEEYRLLQNKYLNLQKQVQEIEEWNAKVHDFMDNNSKYYNLVIYYLEYLDFKKNTEEAILTLQEQHKAIDVSEEEQSNILNQIDEYDRSLEEARLHIVELEEDPENKKVFQMLLTVKEYERVLPTVYQNLRILKKEIDEKYERLNLLKEQLVEYQSILLQIEGLTDENLD